MGNSTLWIYTVVYLGQYWRHVTWMLCNVHSNTMGFLRNNWKIRSLPIKPPRHWGWNKAIASKFSVDHINLDAQNSSNSWSNHVHPFHCVPTIWLSQLWRRFCTAARCRERLLTKPWCRGIRWEPHCSRCSICLLQLRAPSTRLEKT